MNSNTSKFVSINRVFAKLHRDLGMLIEPIQEGDMVEWAGEALEAIGAVTLYEESVAFVEVKNHQAELPNALHTIIQLAKNECFSESKKICASDIVQAIEEQEESFDPVPLDCKGQPISDYELAYYRPYFDLRDETGYFTSRDLYAGCFVPVRLSNHTFFNSLVCQTENIPYEANTHYEYTIVNGTTLRFSFQEGQIAISYLKQILDENGYPKIPEHYSYITAITKYITMKLMEREFYQGTEGSVGKLQKAERDWHWYCKQARNRALMPKGVDQLQNILHQRQYILPRMNRYYGFFGKMSNAETRKFNDPDGRNYFNGFYNTSYS